MSKMTHKRRQLPISTRYPHQMNIPLWMVEDLNRYQGADGHLTMAHKREYWEDVAAYPEVMVRPYDRDTSSGYTRYVKPGRWQGCLRVLPIGNTRRYAPCRFPISEDNFCYHHIPKAILDGKVPSASPQSARERMTLGDLSIDVMDYLDNRFDIIEKKINDLHDRLDPDNEDDPSLDDLGVAR